MGGEPVAILKFFGENRVAAIMITWYNDESSSPRASKGDAAFDRVDAVRADDAIRMHVLGCQRVLHAADGLLTSHPWYEQLGKPSD